VSEARYAFVPGGEFGNMPKIREYKNDPGYYIYARPSDAGNVTYGIDEVAYPIFNELGYEHEDPISWRIIQVLKQVGLDDTDGKGTTPDPDPITFETEESPDLGDKEQFYELLKETKQLSAEDEEAVRETLGLSVESIEKEKSKFELQNRTPEGLADHWESHVEKTLDEELKKAFSYMTTEHLLIAEENDDRSISVTEMGDSYEEDYIITIEEVGVDNGRVIEYQVFITNKTIVVDMINRFELSPEARAEAFSHVAIIDEVFTEHISSFNTSKPTVELRF